MSEERTDNLFHGRSRGLDAALDFRCIHAAADEVIIEYDVGAKDPQPYGIVHGGSHCAAVESACCVWGPEAILAAKRLGYREAFKGCR